MSSGRKRDFPRLLIVLALILMGVFIAFDISRPDSLFRSWFGPQPPQYLQPEELIDAIDAVRRAR